MTSSFVCVSVAEGLHTRTSTPQTWSPQTGRPHVGTLSSRLFGDAGLSWTHVPWGRRGGETSRGTTSSPSRKVAPLVVRVVVPMGGSGGRVWGVVSSFLSLLRGLTRSQTSSYVGVRGFGRPASPVSRRARLPPVRAPECVPDSYVTATTGPVRTVGSQRPPKVPAFPWTREGESRTVPKAPEGPGLHYPLATSPNPKR